MTHITKHIRITGRVQGVGFRAWTAAEARVLGLSGWVRNEADGSVSALLSGPEGAVGQMLRALRRGPRLARVREVVEAPGVPPDEPGFEQRPSV